MTEETILKIETFCNAQYNCCTCPIHLDYRIIDPHYPGELLDICEKGMIEMTPEEEQIILTIIEREEAKNART